MITILMGFCESLTFCASNKIETVGNIANACQELRFPGVWVVFMTKMFDVESQYFVTYVSQYVVI